jgi:hypothetical protein
LTQSKLTNEARLETRVIVDVLLADDAEKMREHMPRFRARMAPIRSDTLTAKPAD